MKTAEEKAMKKYIIEITDNGKTVSMLRKNDGFTSVELVGFVEIIKSDLIAQFKGIAENEVDVITKQAVERE